MNDKYWLLETTIDVIDYELKTVLSDSLVLAILKEKPTREKLAEIFFKKRDKQVVISNEHLNDIDKLIHNGEVMSTIGRNIHNKYKNKYTLTERMFD